MRERLATSQLVRWDFLVVRLMQGAEGDLVIDGMPYLYPVATKDVLLRAMRRAHLDFKRTVPFGGPVDFFKHVGMAFHQVLTIVTERLEGAGTASCASSGVFPTAVRMSRGRISRRVALVEPLGHLLENSHFGRREWQRSSTAGDAVHLVDHQWHRKRMLYLAATAFVVYFLLPLVERRLA